MESQIHSRITASDKDSSLTIISLRRVTMKNDERGRDSEIGIYARRHNLWLLRYGYNYNASIQLLNKTIDSARIKHSRTKLFIYDFNFSIFRTRAIIFFGGKELILKVFSEKVNDKNLYNLSPYINGKLQQPLDFVEFPDSSRRFSGGLQSNDFQLLSLISLPRLFSIHSNLRFHFCNLCWKEL